MFSYNQLVELNKAEDAAITDPKSLSLITRRRIALEEELRQRILFYKKIIKNNKLKTDTAEVKTATISNPALFKNPFPKESPFELISKADLERVEEIELAAIKRVKHKKDQLIDAEINEHKASENNVIAEVNNKDAENDLLENTKPEYLNRFTIDLMAELRTLKNDERAHLKAANPSFSSAVLHAAESSNATVSTIGILFATLGATTALALKLGAPACEALNKALPYFAFAMPLAIGSMALGGVIDTVKALKDEKTEARTITILEGFSRTGLSLLALNLAVITTFPFALPLVFLNITAGMALKEHKLLESTRKHITTLTESITKDKELLHNRKEMLKTNHSDQGPEAIHNIIKNDPQVQRLSMQIAEKNQQLEVRTQQEKSLKKSRAILLGVGLASVGLFLIAAAFPPLSLTAIALTAVGLALFLTLNRLITHVKTKEFNAIEGIKKTSLPTQKIIENRSTLQVFSLYNHHKKELDTQKNVSSKWSVANWFRR